MAGREDEDVLRVFVITNDNSLWCLSPFTYLFNKYWSPEQEVVIAGYHRPKFEIPRNFSFYSLGPVNAPQDKWSNGLIKLLTEAPDDFSIFMLEDYWISRPVDAGFMKVAHNYMQSDSSVIRFDLTGDVAYCNGDERYAFDYGFINHYDVVYKPTDKSYRMSFQSGIWNNKLLLSLLQKDKSPWEVELQTVIPEHLLVLGTKQWPLRYVNAVWKGELDIVEIEKLNPDDYELIKTTFPEDMRRKKID
jgi:hypothetical protein